MTCFQIFDYGHHELIIFLMFDHGHVAILTIVMVIFLTIWPHGYFEIVTMVMVNIEKMVKNHGHLTLPLLK